MKYEMICYKDRSIDISMLEGQGWECVSTLKDKVTYVYAKDNQRRIVITHTEGLDRLLLEYTVPPSVGKARRCGKW
mgnify:FL=1|jgi:hypothetical protein